jgi:hypothetical protein
MINEFERDLEGSGRSLSRSYRRISLDGLKKTTENFSEDCQYPGPKIEEGNSNTRYNRRRMSQFSVKTKHIFLMLPPPPHPQEFICQFLSRSIDMCSTANVSLFIKGFP